jgi:hypothetical protein
MPRAKKRSTTLEPSIDLNKVQKDLDARMKRLHLSENAGSYIGEERIIYGFSEYQMHRIVRSDNPLGCALLADEGDWQEPQEHGIERAIRNGRPTKRAKRGGTR